MFRFRPPAPVIGTARTHWISRPSIDLMVGCGGWSAPVLLLAYLLIESQADGWAAVFYALALLCNYPHYMATIHRAYGQLEDRRAFRVFTHHVTAAIVAVAVAAHVWPALLPWLFTAYVMWSPWHYAGQNFGLSMMFLRRAGLDVSSRERRWLHSGFVASYVLLIAAFNQGASHDRFVLSLGLPDSMAWSIQAASALVFIGGSLLCFGRLARRTTLRALLPALILCSTQALWFVVPVVVSRMSAAPSAQFSYSAGALALMHSAQYLWITQHYARRESIRRAGPSAWSRPRYWTLLILGGMALFIPVPWAASLVGHADFASSVLIVAAAVNIHHFLLDGVVWKLRDPKVSQALVSVDTPRRPSSSWGPIERASPPRRRVVLVGASVALVGLALIDQFRYVLVTQPVDAASLEIARALNPSDSRIHHATVKWLIESGRLREASRENSRLLALWPRDVDALINAGVLAQRLGDVDAAATWWRRALVEEDDRADVHLYLAEFLDEAGRPAEAVPHYRRYLELVVDSPTASSDARRVALVLIKFADALSQSGQSDNAATEYTLAAQIAHAAGLSEIEVLAVERIQLPNRR
jgi:tetratricopeptide (TPR) repeat protein